MITFSANLDDDAVNDIGLDCEMRLPRALGIGLTSATRQASGTTLVERDMFMIRVIGFTIVNLQAL